MRCDLMRRLEQIERRRTPEQRVCPEWIVAKSDEEQAAKIADLEARGIYKPGDFLIAWRIVDPPPYRRPGETIQ